MFQGLLSHILFESETVTEPVTDFATSDGFFDQGVFKLVVEATGAPLVGWQYALIVLIWFALMAIPYLLGSLNFAIIISKRFYNDDIRNYGSKNAGLTNMVRTYGKKAAIMTFIGDALKTVISLLLGYVLHGNIGAYIAAFFCILGHIFPAYYRFHGGKGVLVVAVSILMLDPRVFLILFIVFAVIFGSTKYVSLASIMCMLMFPLVVNWFSPGLPVIFSFLFAAVVIFMHRSNMVRLWNGKEPKTELKKHKKTAPKDEEE